MMVGGKAAFPDRASPPPNLRPSTKPERRPAPSDPTAAPEAVLRVRPDLVPAHERASSWEAIDVVSLGDLVVVVVAEEAERFIRQPVRSGSSMSDGPSPVTRWWGHGPR